MDTNPRRFCTVPKILGFRDWFERSYGDLCEVHDAAYDEGKELLKADLKFIGGMISQDWQKNKVRLLFSVPAAPIIFVLFTGFKIYKWGKKWISTLAQRTR